MKPNYTTVSACISMLAEHRCPRCNWPNGRVVEALKPNLHKRDLCDFCRRVTETRKAVTA